MKYAIIYTIDAPKYSTDHASTAVVTDNRDEIPTIIALSRGVKTENVKILICREV